MNGFFLPGAAIYFELEDSRGYFSFLNVVDYIMLHNTSLTKYPVETLFYIFRSQALACSGITCKYK